jgi:aspartate--ammonia ligase
MSYLIKPAGYKALLNLSQTEMGIKKIKDFFQQNLSSELRLRRVTAPLFVLKGMGINDDLNGTERAVTFPIKDLDLPNGNALLLLIIKSKKATVSIPT